MGRPWTRGGSPACPRPSSCSPTLAVTCDQAFEPSAGAFRRQAPGHISALRPISALSRFVVDASKSGEMDADTLAEMGLILATHPFRERKPLNPFQLDCKQ